MSLNIKKDEKQKQMEFYKNILPRVDKSIDIEDILQDNSDGVINGNILEFKNQINDINSVLFQTIKYLSSRRIKGKEIPKNILLISFNDNQVYVFNSGEYIKEIEKSYFSSASVDNQGFKINGDFVKLDIKKQSDIENIINLLKEKEYTKINIDDNCIIGWAERFYKEKPGTKKQDFIGDQEGIVTIKGEIRKPTIFKEFINPYTGKSNIKFKYLMDKLNDNLSQKNLGAFYTPDLYSNKALELVREAIKRVPEGNDYIILDRCAGTGNLESQLTEEELKHVIVSTLEYYEYKVLLENIGDKVRHIIPPMEVEETFNQGLVTGADALSEEYLRNDILSNYINNSKCTIILFENPPYAETTSIEHQKMGQGKNSSLWKKSFVVQEMKKEIKGKAVNELSNAFIWSGFNYYLREKTDSYVLFAPIKYWKSQKIIDKKYIKGFTFNRKHFHTNTNATITCSLWSNEDKEESKLEYTAYDIVEGKLQNQGKMIAKKVNSLYSEYLYPKYKSVHEEVQPIFCGLNGKVKTDKISVKDYNIKQSIGYLVSQSSSFDNPRLGCQLVRKTLYNGHGCYITKGNYYETLPIFSAGKYTDHINDWKIMSFIMKSADGYERYINDVKKGNLEDYLLKTLLWTSLTHYSHMRTFEVNDKIYRNELCLDVSNGETEAYKKLKELKKGKYELELFEEWEKLINMAKQTKEYNYKYTYGLYQIDEEINTKYKDENDKTIYNYPILNGQIKLMKKIVKDYYIKNLIDKLFEYEFLK